jgi:hypothetical protein
MLEYDVLLTPLEILYVQGDVPVKLMVKLVDCPSVIVAVPEITPVAVGRMVTGKVLKLIVEPLTILIR